MSIRALFLTEGGKGIGFGHAARCVALSEALAGLGVESDFIVNGDESLSSIFGSRNVTLSDWRSGGDDFFRRLGGYGLVVVDSYLAGRDFYERLSASVRHPVYIDDYARLDYPAGCVVNASVHANRDYYGAKEGMAYLAGPEYILLRSEYRDVPEKIINGSVSSVMVTFGGDDMRDLTPRVVELLEKFYPDVRKKVIIGSAFRSKNPVPSGESIEIVRAPDAAKMKEMMLESDIAVSAGGQTIHELARTGIPTVAIAVADNQMPSLKACGARGMLLFAGRYDDKEVMGNLKKALDGMMDTGVRAALSGASRTVIDGKGAGRLAAGLLEYAGHKAGV